jgi:penicillin-insensitive murein DD-endopeptidase
MRLPTAIFAAAAIAVTAVAPVIAATVKLPPARPATAPAAPPAATTPAPGAAAPPAPTTPTTAAIAVPDKPPLPEPRPSMKESKTAAKFLFAAKQLPSIGKAAAIGYYPRGCLQGGVELPVNGPTWQVMRLSRNRNWGHPELIKFLERFAPLAAKATGWHGILVGDLAQPRGGPLPFGHASHQIGLDVDIWFMPMPDHTLNKQEREDISASNLVAEDGKHVNPKTWKPETVKFIKTAAEQPEVERVLVNAAIKKEMCRVIDRKHDAWMYKVRPWYGHADHIHVRLKCPADSPHCRPQDPPKSDDGCAAKDLAYWFTDKVVHPKYEPPKGPTPKGLMLKDLPPACKTVLDAPAKKNSLAADGH